MYKVSILTSIYNGSKYLESFLDNISKQTIFDDCQLCVISALGPDRAEEEKILGQYLHLPNIRYIKLDSRIGIYNCWNIGIRETDSQYITNANVDDKIYPQCLEIHADLLDNEPNIDVAYCLNLEVDNFDLDNITNAFIYPTANFSKELLLQANLPHNHPVWRRSLHDSYGYFNEVDYVSGSDWEFWLRCAAGGAQMKLIREVLGIYYRNPEGVSSDAKNLKRNLEEIDRIRNLYRNK